MSEEFSEKEQRMVRLYERYNVDQATKRQIGCLKLLVWAAYLSFVGCLLILAATGILPMPRVQEAWSTARPVSEDVARRVGFGPTNTPAPTATPIPSPTATPIPAFPDGMKIRFLSPIQGKAYYTDTTIPVEWEIDPPKEVVVNYALTLGYYGVKEYAPLKGICYASETCAVTSMSFSEPGEYYFKLQVCYQEQCWEFTNWEFPNYLDGIHFWVKKP